MKPMSLNDEVIHCVRFSAYEALKAELEAVKRERDIARFEINNKLFGIKAYNELHKDSESLRTQLSVAKEALELAEKDLTHTLKCGDHRRRIKARTPMSDDIFKNNADLWKWEKQNCVCHVKTVEEALARITGETCSNPQIFVENSKWKIAEAQMILVTQIIRDHGCSSPKDCGLHFLAQKLNIKLGE